MISNSSTKSARCIGNSFDSAARRDCSSSERIISRTVRMRVSSKNMCSVRHSPMPSPPNLMAVRASSGGVDANAELADGIGPAHQRAEFARQFRLDHRHPAGQHLAQRAVDGDDVAGLEGARADAHRAAAVIDANGAAAGDAGLAHAARDHGGVRGHAAAGGENAFGGVHAVNVFRAGLDPHQNDVAAVGLQAWRLRRTRTRSRPMRRRARPAGRSRSRRAWRRIDGRMQQ